MIGLAHRKGTNGGVITAALGMNAPPIPVCGFFDTVQTETIPVMGEARGRRTVRRGMSGRLSVISLGILGSALNGF